MADSSSAHSPDSRLRIAELSTRGKRLHRRILAPEVLRGILPLRAGALRRSSLPRESRDREQQFRQTSSAYAHAMADIEEAVASTRVVSLDSLRWWVPLTVPDDPVLVERALKHQDFPYRAITQTREVALGGAMIDIGANIGRMSIPRVILGDVTMAYCAEPDPLNYTCLVRNTRDNHLTGLVLPDQLAIGSENGIVRLERAKSAGGHRVIGEGAKSRPRREVLEVRSLTLDSWVDFVGIDLDQVRFVKVDAQGSEIDVLRGAARVLERKYIAWQMEIDLEILGHRGFGSDDIYVLMQQHFTHFVDLNGHLTTARVRPVGELGAALSYLSGETLGRTDVVLFTLAPASQELPASQGLG